MKKSVFLLLFCLLWTALTLTGCENRGAAQGDITESSTVQAFVTTSAEISSAAEAKETEQSQEQTEETGEMKMNVNVNGQDFTASLEENEAADALVEMLEQGAVTIQMSDYGGFEKVGSLGRSLPAENSQTTTVSGDIVLYMGNQIVMFYGSNSWSYTRLGHIDDLIGWEEALGSGEVTVTLSIEG